MLPKIIVAESLLHGMRSQAEMSGVASCYRNN